MKIVPVRHYVEPRFPTRDEFSGHPELLRCLPLRWRRNAVLASVVATACSASLLLSSCRSREEQASTPIPAPKPKPTQYSVNTAERGDTPISRGARIVRVAPIFHHGDYDLRGMYVTMPTTAPILLPEDEARQIICETLAKAHIDVTHEGPSISGGKVPVHSAKPEDAQLTLILDGSDSRHKIAYEYLSMADVSELKLANMSLGTMSACAKAVRDAVTAAQTDDTIAVFYDPAPNIGGACGPMSLRNETTPGMKTSKRFSDATLAPLGLLQYDRPDGETIPPPSGATPPPPITVEEQQEKISLHLDGRHIVLKVGSNVMEVNGRTDPLPCPVIRRYGTVYFPLRPVARALDIPVGWDKVNALVSFQRGKVKQTGEVYDDRQTGLSFVFLRYDLAGRTRLATELGREELRSQVQDFIDWLKSEGII